MPENIYDSPATKCLTPNSSSPALTREQKFVKFASLLQQNKALEDVQRYSMLFHQKPFFSSTEAKLCCLLNVTFMCIQVNFPASLKKAINCKSNGGEEYDSILSHKRK